MQTVTDRFARAFNTLNPELLADVYRKDAKMTHAFFPGVVEGRDAILAAERPMFQAFSDVRWTALSVVEEGDRLAVEYHVEGTNTGPIATPQGTIPATQKRVDLRGMSLLSVDADGRVVEERRYFDVALFMRQLGLA